MLALGRKFLTFSTRYSGVNPVETFFFHLTFMRTQAKVTETVTYILLLSNFQLKRYRVSTLKCLTDNVGLRSDLSINSVWWLRGFEFSSASRPIRDCRSLYCLVLLIESKSSLRTLLKSNVQRNVYILELQVH